MPKHTFVTALPTRLAALAALGLLITACGNESSEVDTPLPQEDAESDESPNETDPDEEGEDTATDQEDSAEVELTIERTLTDDDALTPESGFEEGTLTLTCGPDGGDHPDPEAACAEIEEVGAEPFTLDTSDKMCTQQVGGPESAHVTGEIGDTAIDTEFSKMNGCEIDRFEDVNTVLNP